MREVRQDVGEAGDVLRGADEEELTRHGDPGDRPRAWHLGRRVTLRSGQSPWLIPETGRKVALPQVVEQGDEAPDSLAARHAFDAHQVGARRLPDEEAGAPE